MTLGRRQLAGERGRLLRRQPRDCGPPAPQVRMSGYCSLVKTSSLVAFQSASPRMMEHLGSRLPAGRRCRPARHSLWHFHSQKRQVAETPWVDPRSGLGYCFSAALPPYLATAASGAIDRIRSEEGCRLAAACTANARRMRGLLADVPGGTHPPGCSELSEQLCDTSSNMTSIRYADCLI